MYNSLLDMGNGVFYRSGKCVLRDGLRALCRLDSFLRSLHDTVALQCGDIYYFTAELTGELRKIDLIPVFLDDIHHVDRNNDRDTKLCELCGQVEVSLEVRTIDDI